MSNLVIVAIPDENDRVWKVSSEKIPHLTLLFLGDADKVSNLQQIVEFVEHAANTTLRRFYLPVDRRDALGEDQADTLIFKKGRYDYKAIRDFRVQLLKDNNIRKAYDATEQHEGPWMPHLTLGYPTNPAKADDTDRDFGFYDVAFNKIAVWPEEYAGPEFLIKDYWDEFDALETVPMDLVMSGVTEAELAHYGTRGVRWGVRPDDAREVSLEIAAPLDLDERSAEDGAEFMVHKGIMSSDHFLEHHGVKGMKWGVRKDDSSGPIEGSAAKGTFRSRRTLEKHTGTGNFSKRTEIRFALFGPAALFDSKVRAELKEADRKIQVGKADEKWGKGVKDGSAWIAVNNASADHFNKGIDAVNKKHPPQPDWPGQDHRAPTSAAFKSYMKDINQLSADSIKHAATQLDLKSPSGKREVEVTSYGPGDFGLKVKEVQHAADDNVIRIKVNFQADESGRVTGFTFADDADEIAQSMEAGADFLKHFGVKGMRWGVRKEEDGAGKVGNAAKSVGKAAVAVGKALGDANFEAKISDERKLDVEDEIITKAREALKRTDLPAIKAKPEYQEAKKLKNRLLNPRDAATKAYRKEVKDAYISRMEQAANSMTNASGTRQYTIRDRGWELPASGGALPQTKYGWDVTSREIKHADGDITIRLEVVLDADGFITDLKPIAPEDALAQTMELGIDFLTALGLDVGVEHYGVKGMRWGIRRAKDVPPVAVTPNATSRVPHGDKRKTKIEVEGGQNHDAHPDAIKVAEARVKLKKSGTAALSNQELRDMANRLQLENQVKQLTTSAGKKFITNLLTEQGKSSAKGALRERIPGGQQQQQKSKN